jgi:hypothetical protein
MRKWKRSFRIALVLSILLCGFGLSATTSWANDRFVDNLDGTVTDTKTGLMWQQVDSRKEDCCLVLEVMY